MTVIFVVAFFALFPVSVRIADHYFDHPFHEDWFSPVLLVCSDHVEVHQWNEIGKGLQPGLGTGCSYQIAPGRESWVRNSVRNLQSPAPGKSSWDIDVRQLGAANQRIKLQLVGDGYSGIIYEVRQGTVFPIKSRLTGPGGAVRILGVHITLWVVVSVAIWFFARNRRFLLGAASKV